MEIEAGSRMTLNFVDFQSPPSSPSPPSAVCTSITSHSAPPIAVYGRTLLLYVEVYSHPQPQEEHTVFYHSTRISNTQVSVYQKSPLSPLLTFEYAIPVPLVDLVTIQETDPEDRRVLLTTSFTRSCAEDRNSIDLSIPLLSGEEGKYGSFVVTFLDGVLELERPTACL